MIFNSGLAQSDKNKPPQLLDRFVFKENLNEIFSAIHEGVTVQDKLGSLVYANPAAAKTMGYSSQEELLATPIRNVLDAFDLFGENGEPFDLNLLPGRKVLKGENGSAVVIKWIHKRFNKESWSECTAYPVHDLKGELSFVINIFRDITQQKEIETKLALINRRNFHILQSIKDAFLVVSYTGDFLDANENAEKILKKKRADFVGKKIWEIFPHFNTTNASKKFQEVVYNKKNLTFEEYFTTKGDIWLQFDCYAVNEGIAVYFRDITEEKKRIHSINRLVEIVSSSDDAILSKSLEGVVTSWNRAAEKLYGYKSEEIVGKSIKIIYPPNFNDEFKKIISNIKNNIGIDHYETKRLTKDGRIVDVSVSISPLKDEKGNVTEAAVIARDISERKRTEELLRNSEKNLRDFFDSATIGLHWWEEDGVIVRANRELTQLLEYPAQDYLGKNIRELYVDPSKAEELIVRVKSGEAVKNFRAEVKTRSGKIKYILVDSVGATVDGKFQARSFIRDITDRTEMEEALTRSEKRFRSLIEHSSEGVVILDQAGRFTYLSPTITDLLGYLPSELQGINAFDPMHPEDKERVMKIFMELLQKPAGEIMRADYRYLHKNGEWKWLEATANNLLSEDGVHGVVVNYRDITETRDAQEKLIISERRYKALFENSSDAIALIDERALIKYLSPAVKYVLGYEPDELVGINGLSLVHPEDRERLTATLKDLTSEPGKRLVVEVRVKLKDGDYIWTESVVSNLLQDKEINSIVSNFRNIHQRKRVASLQQMIFNASKQLSSSLDYKKTLTSLANSATNNFADWCVMDFVENEKRVGAAVAHKDPEKVELLKKFQVEFSSTLDKNFGEVIATKRSVLIPEVTDGMLTARIKDKVQLDYIKQLGLHSVILAPIIHGEEVYGIISMASAESGRKFDQLDLEFSEELGRLAGNAIQNARLYNSAKEEIEIRKEAEGNALKSELRYRSLVSSLSSIVWLTNSLGEFSNSQPSWEEYTGQTPSQYQGWGWLDALHPQDRGIIRNKWKQALESRVLFQAEGRIWNNKTEAYRYFESKAVPILEPDGKITEWVGTVNDVHDRALAEEQKRHAQHQMEYSFLHDSLTDLPNRVLFNDRLSEKIMECVKNQNLLSVMIIDLDRFKLVNESLGHAIGDRLLQEVGLRLASSLSDTGILARLGGDEFGILLADIEREEEVASVCQRILDALKHPFILDGHELYVTPSLGITLYPFDGEDAPTLLKNADSALYRAKEQGRNNFQFYNASMNATTFQQLTLESALRKALKQNEFKLYYQPQIDPITGRVIELEALIRWTHPEFGLIFPDEFIRPAENTGLIESIGEWVIKQALSDVKKWHKMGFESLEVAINLSARQFKQKHFVRMIRRIISENNFNPHRLEFELTESLLMDKTANVYNTLHELKKDGVKFSIDDFNTGYSSLNYIKRFPIDILKIDKSFVKGLPTKEKDAAIANSIINLGHSLNMLVVAEGVERDEQLNFLKDRGCDKIQGYLICPPIPAEAMTEFLTAKK